MRSRSLRIAVIAMAVSFACAKDGPPTYQGYVEGEFVHVAAATGGHLERLFVQRGQTIEADASLFQLDTRQEAAAVHQADETAAAARAQLADLKTGKRSLEIEVMRAQ